MLDTRFHKAALNFIQNGGRDCDRPRKKVARPRKWEPYLLHEDDDGNDNDDFCNVSIKNTQIFYNREYAIPAFLNAYRFCSNIKMYGSLLNRKNWSYCNFQICCKMSNRTNFVVGMKYISLKNIYGKFSQYWNTFFLKKKKQYFKIFALYYEYIKCNNFHY